MFENMSCGEYLSVQKPITVAKDGIAQILMRFRTAPPCIETHFVARNILTLAVKVKNSATAH